MASKKTRRNLMIVEFVRRYRAALDENIVKLRGIIGNGNIANWEEYKRWTGHVAGLQAARDLLDDEWQTFQKGDD